MRHLFYVCRMKTITKSNKRLVAEGLIILQLTTSFIGISFASADDVSAESTLLSNAIALKAQGISQESKQQELQAEIQDYQQTAPVAGREDRMEQALVQLKIMTADQASTFRAEADSIVATGGDGEADLLNQSIQNALTNSQGAQYSTCEKTTTADVSLAVAGGVLLGLGVSSSEQNGLGRLSMGPHSGTKSIAESATGGGLLIAAFLVLAYGPGC